MGTISYIKKKKLSFFKTNKSRLTIRICEKNGSNWSFSNLILENLLIFKNILCFLLAYSQSHNTWAPPKKFNNEKTFFFLRKKEFILSHFQLCSIFESNSYLEFY